MKPVTLSESSVQRIARALADSPRIRLINQKLDIIMDNQTHIDQDIQALGTAFGSIQAEINDLKAQVAANPPAVPLDFSKLDAAVAQFQALAPTATPSTPSPAPDAAKPNTDAHLEPVPDAPQAVKDAVTDSLDAPNPPAVDPVP